MAKKDKDDWDVAAEQYKAIMKTLGLPEDTELTRGEYLAKIHEYQAAQRIFADPSPAPDAPSVTPTPPKDSGTQVPTNPAALYAVPQPKWATKKDRQDALRLRTEQLKAQIGLPPDAPIDDVAEKLGDPDFAKSILESRNNKRSNGKNDFGIR